MDGSDLSDEVSLQPLRLPQVRRVAGGVGTGSMPAEAQRRFHSPVTKSGTVYVGNQMEEKKL